MNVKVKFVNKHESATADLWHYSGPLSHCTHRNYAICSEQMHSELYIAYSLL